MLGTVKRQWQSINISTEGPTASRMAAIRAKPVAIKARPRSDAHSEGVRPSKGAILIAVKPALIATIALAAQDSGVLTSVRRLMLA
jgi:hypothetical protein